jgi:hypothetical protein
MEDDCMVNIAAISTIIIYQHNLLSDGQNG